MSLQTMRAYRDSADQWASGLSDEEVTRWTAYALDRCPPVVRQMHEQAGRNVRNSRSLCGMAYDAHRTMAMEREAFG